MKRIVYTLIVIFIGCMTSCLPGKYEILEMDMVDMNDIQEIKLRLNHFQLLADNKAQIEFSPLLTTKDSFEVLDSRVDHSQIEYYTTSGEMLSKTFSTADRSLIGKTIDVYAKIKGTGLTSNTASFTVMDPAISDAYTEITVPVIFHLMQSKDEILAYGGEMPIERINLLLDKINNTFSGRVSTNPMGVDTKIRFKAAVYDPYGNKLHEPGVHRIYADKVIDSGKDQFQTFIKEQNALWPYDQYLNVWLISDREKEYRYFYYDITRECQPKYVYPGVNPDEMLEGLELSPQPTDYTPEPKDVGILYKYQSLLKMEYSTWNREEFELVNSFGYYLGLLPTYGGNEDYCSDTHKYRYGRGIGYKRNETAYKLVGDYFFLAENIMDDAVGVHRSVSQQQSLRARWILENCPQRSAWKSDYAFTGK